MTSAAGGSLVRRPSSVVPPAGRWQRICRGRAINDFFTGALLDNPHRVGKRLDAPLDDQHSARMGAYRILYGIDDQARPVTVRFIHHRRDAYRT